MRQKNRSRLLIFLTLCLAAAWAVVSLSACTQTIKSSTAGAKASLYERVMHSGKLRCGYLVYTPGCIKNLKTGKMEGVGPEVLELVAERLGLELEWTEEVGLVSMIEGLETGRYDIVGSPIWANSSRAKVADFSRPFYYSPVCAFTRKGDDRFTGKLSAINSDKVTIATMDGEMSSIIARADFPRAKILSLPQLSEMSQLILTVATGKADVVFADPAEVFRFVEHNPNSVQNITPDHPVRVFGDTYMFSRGQSEFKAMLNTTLDELINSGEIDKVIAKYEAYPNAYFRVAFPYRSDYRRQ
jgi:ABC-type amino acid transport substrate-binding protein